MYSSSAPEAGDKKPDTLTPTSLQLWIVLLIHQRIIIGFNSTALIVLVKSMNKFDKFSDVGSERLMVCYMKHNIVKIMILNVTS